MVLQKDYYEPEVCFWWNGGGWGDFGGINPFASKTV